MTSKTDEQKDVNEKKESSLFASNTYTKVPNNLFCHVLSNSPVKERLFLYVIRMTCGFTKKARVVGESKTRTLHRLAMPWPGSKAVAKKLKVSKYDNLTRAKSELIRTGRIIEWKVGKQTWVMVNPALLLMTAEEMSALDFSQIKWFDVTKPDETLKRVKDEFENNKDYQIRYVGLSQLIVWTIRFDISTKIKTSIFSIITPGCLSRQNL